MPNYSEQDLKYAAEFRAEIHREALAIVRKTRPDVQKVIDRHPVEEYFQENWEYPGKWYTIVAIPYGYKSRKALVDQIVRDTLSGESPENERTVTKEHDTAKADYDHLTAEPKPPQQDSDPFYSLIDAYPGLVVDYHIVQGNRYCGYESHRTALRAAYDSLGEEWEGNPARAAGKMISVEALFSPDSQDKKLNYRKAFLYPPHGSGCTGKDFALVNAALFPNGTDELEVYEWTTDWSDYFDDGHEWWGTLCLTVYDKTLNRFAVIMASATD